MLYGFDFELLLLRVPALLIGITVHEFAHARMAYHYGDATARAHGRMNLNPINHLDPIGSLMILLVGFGWAKPVPINPFNFRDRRAGLLWVSFAGPLSNLITAFLFFILLYSVGLIGFYHGDMLFDLVFWIVFVNILLAVFNLVPIPPLDGSKILISLAPSDVAGFLHKIEPFAPIILIVLVFTGVLGSIVWPVAFFILDLYELIISYLFGFFI